MRRKEKKIINDIVLELMDIVFLGNSCSNEKLSGRMECALTIYEKYKKNLDGSTISAVEEIKQRLMKSGAIVDIPQSEL